MIGVTLQYDPVAQQLTETLTDQSNSTIPSYMNVYTGVDLAAILGTNTALIGITGATGGVTATQTVSNFSYNVGTGAYANGIVINGAATVTLDVGATAAIPNVSFTGLTVAGGGPAVLNVTASTAPTDQAYGVSFAGGTLNSSLSINVANNGAGAGTVTLGAISDGGGNYSLSTTGPGVVVLNGANTYGGNTNVSAGTLRLADGSANNIASSPTITIGGGATLDVTGLASSTLVLGNGGIAQKLAGPASKRGDNPPVNGSVSVTTGSTIAAGSGATLAITGSLALADGSHSSFTLGTPSGPNNAPTSLVNITGGLTLSGTDTVDLSGAAVAPGTYELFAFTSGTPTASQFTIGSNTAGSYIYTFSVIPNQEVDLSVSSASNASWNVNGGGSFNLATNWSPANVPSAPGVVANFGNGVPATTVNVASLTVAIDAPEVLGGLVFNNTNGTDYNLGNSGGSLTLNNNGLGATVSVAASGNANPTSTIYAQLILADNATFNVAAGNTLNVSVNGGPTTISESGGSHSLTKSGLGTLIVDRASSYTGGTTANNGILTVTAGGSSIGSGPLEVDGPGGNVTTVNLNSSQSVAGLGPGARRAAARQVA